MQIALSVTDLVYSIVCRYRLQVLIVEIVHDSNEKAQLNQ